MLLTMDFFLVKVETDIFGLRNSLLAAKERA